MRILLNIILISLSLNFSFKPTKKIFFCDEKLNEKLAQRFQGGADAFYKYIAKNVIYPQKARENCIMGYCIVNFDLSNDKKISNITINSKFGYGIEEGITKVIQDSENKWLESTDINGKETHFEFTIQFFVALPKQHPPSKFKYDCAGIVIVVGISNNTNCPTEDDLKNSIEKHLKKKNYKKLVDTYEDLIRRFPLDKEYQEELIKYQKLLEKK